MATMQDVVDLARNPALQDSDAFDADRRWPDADLLRFATHAIQNGLSLRPDLFVGSFLTLPSITLTLGSTFPLPDNYMQPIADYVVFRAMSGDAEHVNDGTAVMFAQIFAAEMGVL